MLGLAAKRVLVVESDGLSIRAAVVTARPGGKVRIEGLWESALPKFESALNEVLARMRQAGVRPPTQAILVAPQLRATVLPLPVPPHQALPHARMQELLRWELDPYFSQARVLRVGSILAARGHVTPAELADIAASLEPREGREGIDGQGRQPRRFGEIAIDAGLISPEQLEEALSIQDALQEGEGELVCGWTALSQEATDGNWDWLVCGIARSLRDRYVQNFRDHRIQLRAIYPLAGCAAAAGLDGEGNPRCGVLEYQAGVLTHTVIANGRIARVRTRYVTDPGQLVDASFDLLGDESESALWLAGYWPETDRMCATLSARLGQPCAPVPVERGAELAENVDGPAVAGMIGAARHFMRLARATSGVSVRGRDPRQPLSRQPAFWVAATSCAVVLAWAGLEITLAARLDALRERARLAETVESEQKAIDTLNRQLLGLRRLEAFLTQELELREAFVPVLLDALRDVISDEIALSRLYEDERGVIHLVGSGASEKAIQLFKLGVSDALRPVGKDARHLQVEASDDADLGPTYSFRFEVIQTSGGARSSRGGRR